MKLKVKLFVIGLLLVFTASSQHKDPERPPLRPLNAIKKFPRPVGYVNDFENLLTKEQIADLDSCIAIFRRATTNQVVIVTIDSIQPYVSLQDFTTDLGNYWGVGLNDKDNGLMIVVSKTLRNTWIGTGYGTEKILTNDILDVIIATKMVPHFKKGEFYEGIKAGLLECMKKWK